MSISISSALSSISTAVANPASTTAAAQKPQPTTNDSADVVRLSESQQVYQLYIQGQRVSQIAASLRLSVAAVNSYLNISAVSK